MHLLIPAAGLGKRMGSDRNKLLLTLFDQPLLAWTLQAAQASNTINWIGLIGQSYDFSAFEKILAALNLTKPVECIQGGETRQESVYNGLQGLPEGAERVLIHDGARCLVTPDLFDRCSETLQTCPGLIAAVPVKDTIKVVGEDSVIQDTPNRQHL
ncbi:MAG: 2-C-methyl-D-erythritol 4-phosphate cytidylyltransferase [Kamptonema sp. SIO4C4]|nr:2-C-methyl-D-erythritol 4-phosphate cytidylyltransferase [Kamptonema sp. SIO4C4]